MKNPFIYITIFVTTIIAIWSVTRWQKSSIGQRLLIVLLVITSIEEIIALWMMHKRINNLWISHVYTLVELGFFLVIFHFWAIKKNQRLLILICGIAFVVFWVTSKLTIESFSKDDTYTSAIAKIIEVAMAIRVLFVVLRDSNLKLIEDERIWITSGIILYSSGTLILFSLFESLLTISRDLLKIFWYANWILLIITNILYARGIMSQNSKSHYPASAGTINQSQTIHKE